MHSSLIFSRQRIVGAGLLLAGLLFAIWRISVGTESKPDLTNHLELAARSLRAPPWEHEVAQNEIALYAFASSLSADASPDDLGGLTRMIQLAPAMKQGQPKDGMSMLETTPEPGAAARSASLGMTSLRLAGLLLAEKAQPGFTEAVQIRSLGNFLVYLQKYDGSFFSSLDARSGRFFEAPNKFEQSRSAGQAALALVMLAEWDTSPERAIWLAAARRALYQQRLSVETLWPDFGNWTIMAMERLLHLSPALPRSEAKVLKDFVRQKLSIETLQHIDLQEDSPNYGCYDVKTSVLITASRLEGMVAALAVTLSEMSEDEGRLSIRAAQLALGCLLRAQITTGPFRGAFSASSTETQPMIVATLQATLAIAHYRELRLPFVPFTEIDREGRQVARNSALWTGNSLSGLNLRGFYIKNWLASSATFSRCDFQLSVFKGGSFYNAALIESNFRRASFNEVDMRELKAASSDFREVKFERSDLRAADFSFSDLSRVSFVSVDLRGASFLGARLEGATYDQHTNLPFDHAEAERRGFHFVAAP